MGKYTKVPKMPFQRGENCQIALDYIKLEGIHFTNVGTSHSHYASLRRDLNALRATVTDNHDIAKGDVKRTAGLLFALMERYHFGWVLDLPTACKTPDLNPGTSSHRHHPPPRTHPPSRPPHGITGSVTQQSHKLSLRTRAVHQRHPRWSTYSARAAG